jgi:hypothetical protein
MKKGWRFSTAFKAEQSLSFSSLTSDPELKTGISTKK